MKFGLSRRRRGRRGDEATISHKGPYVRHLNFDEQSRSDYSGIVDPFTNEIEECVRELCLKDITTQTEPKLASEWVSMKQRAGDTPSLLQKDKRGLSGTTSGDVAKFILEKIRTIKSQHPEERELMSIVATSVQPQWYMSNGVVGDLFDTTQHIVPGQDFVRCGLVVDVTWRTVHDGDIFEIRKQYGGFIPYVLDLVSSQEDIQIRRVSMRDASSGLTVGSSDSANASLNHSQRSEDERCRAPRRARRYGRRASGVEDASSSISDASRVTRFKDMIREFKPVRFAADKLSSYFQSGEPEQEPSQLNDSLDRNSSDRESSQASCWTSKEGNQRRWVRPIGPALKGVTQTMAARRGDLIGDPISHGKRKWGWTRRRERQVNDWAEVHTAEDWILDRRGNFPDDVSAHRSASYLNQVDTTSFTDSSAIPQPDSGDKDQVIGAHMNGLVAVIRATGLHLKSLPPENTQKHDRTFSDWTGKLTDSQQDKLRIEQALECLGVDEGDIRRAELDASSPGRMGSKHHEPATPRSTISTNASLMSGTVTPCTTISTSSMDSIGYNSSGARL